MRLATSYMHLTLSFQLACRIKSEACLYIYLSLQGQRQGVSVIVIMHKVMMALM